MKPKDQQQDEEVRVLKPAELESLKGGAQPGPSTTKPVAPAPRPSQPD